MARRNGPPKSRRGSEPKPESPKLAQLTIKVSPSFKHKLQSYIATVEESAGAYLERHARRDLEEKAARIVMAWAITGTMPPTLPFPGPAGPAEDTDAA